MSTEQSVDEALKDSLTFLDVLTPEDYKEKLLPHLLGMTGTTDGFRYVTKNKKLLDAMIDLICNDKSDKTRLECLRILVNVSSTSPDVLKHLLHPDFIYFLLAAVIQKDADYCDSIAMLLANITQVSTRCELVAENIKNHDQVTLENLVNAFCTQNYNKHCQLHHLGSFLSNLTLLKDVRLLFLNGEDKLIARMLPFTEYEASSVRRFSVASIIKNCLFETEYHEQLLSDTDILSYLLLPLAGAEEFSHEENEELPLDLQYLSPDKKRESNKQTQNLLIESLFQLCATKPCRLIMKDKGVYYIMRELHKIIEEDDPIMLALENLVQVLIGDEPETEYDNLREIEIPDHIQNQFN